MGLKNVMLALTPVALALTTAHAVAQVAPHGTDVVDTRHSVIIHGKKMPYTAHAGLLPLYVNDTGELMGNVFFIAYIADRPSGAPPRPITFLWNGGPGSNSAQVHVVGFGPKRVTTGKTFLEWGEDTETPIVDHEESWFDTSDLVFIDPPGTGFSRATSKEFRDVLYTTRGDAEATAEAIRIFLTRYDMWHRPLFIAGESYGTVRAQWVADALEMRRTHLKGVVLISGGYDTGQQVPDSLTKALKVTHYAMTAHYHHVIAPDLQLLPSEEAAKQAEEWARTVYAPALARIESLNDTERDAVLSGIKRYTGLDPKYVDRKTLAIAPDVYADKLLADRGLEIGRYDSRLALKYRGDGAFWMPWDDPSLRPMRDLMEGTSRVFNSYVRDELGFKSDLLYRGPFGKSFHPEPLVADPKTGYSPDWMAVMFKTQRPGPNEMPPLRRAMNMNPNLMVMNLAGSYDPAVNSCSAFHEAVAESDPSVRPRVVDHCIVGGHMFYSDVESRRIVQRQFADFVRAATAGK